MMRSVAKRRARLEDNKYRIVVHCDKVVTNSRHGPRFEELQGHTPHETTRVAFASTSLTNVPNVLVDTDMP